MMYVEFNTGKNEYKLRLNTRAVASLEKQIGCNPLAIFGTGETIPTITTMVHILHNSLQAYHHGMTLDKCYDVFDEWLEDGHDSTEFIAVIMDIYRASGIIKQEKTPEEEDAEGKN